MWLLNQVKSLRVFLEKIFHRCPEVLDFDGNFDERQRSYYHLLSHSSSRTSQNILPQIFRSELFAINLAQPDHFLAVSFYKLVTESLSQVFVEHD